MTRLHGQLTSEAGAQTEKLFATIKKAAGMLPNTYRDMGMVNPAALEASLNLDGALHRSGLGRQEIEAIKLAVSEVARCEYCLAAHTAIARKEGLDEAAILTLRHGLPSGFEHLDAIANFARTVVTTRGTVAQDALDAVRRAGYSDAQIVGILLAVSAINFTNLFNRVNDTALDFPPAD